MKTKYKVPCSWQMYGHYEVEAENWDDAVWEAENLDVSRYGTGVLPDGEYVMSSFEVDHDMIEFEREEEREKIRKAVDKGFPTGNDVEFGTSME